MPARQRPFTLKRGLLAILLAFPAQQALAANCTWNTAAGNWNALANWLNCATGNGNPAQTPGSVDTATIGAAGVVTVNTAQNVGTLNNAGHINIDAASLTLFSGANNAGGVINVAAGATLNQNSAFITGGTINTTGTGKVVASNSNSNFFNGVTLNGNLDLASGTGIELVTGGLVLNGGVSINNNSVLSFVGDQTLSGNGTIVLGSSGGSNRALSMQGNTVLTVGSNIVVRGENGTLGQVYAAGGTQSIINNGRISADVSGGKISLAPANGTTNNGVLEAQNGGTLELNSNVIGNAGSSIAAGAGSTVLQNGVALSGVINTSGNGTFRAANSNSNFFNGVTLNGNLDLATATGIERVTGGLALNGGISINNNSVLSFAGDQTVSGNGTIVLGNTGASNRALSLEGNTALTIGSNIVVRGENGTLGQVYAAGGTQSIINNGRISADVSGGKISLAPANGTTNNGVLEAQNGGTLELNSNVIGNAGSSIAAGAGSTVLQNGVALSGVINTSGNGTFRAANSNSNFFNGVTLNGNLDLATATGIERVTGGLALNGGISINNNSVLSFAGDQTVSGNGTIVLGNTGASNRALSLEGNTALTIGSNIVVRGENGTLGQVYAAGGTQSIINNGRISADVSGGKISLAPANGTTNNGVLEAQNGGTLELNSNVIGNAGSSIAAGAGSTVLQNGVALSGVINTSGNGTFRAANSNSNFFNGVTLNGNLDLATATGIERVTGGLALNGGISINNNSVLSFAGDQTVSGNGTIVLGNTGASNRALSMQGDTTLTIGSGISVMGNNGTLGQAYLAGGNQVIVNNGSILASVGGGTVALAPTLTQNAALLGATNGGTLRLDSNVTQTGAGQINAAVGSAVLQNGITITGGVINTAGTGRLVVANNNSNILSGVTLAGVIDMASATGIERVSNGLTLNGGTIDVNNNSVLSFIGDQTLGGTGSIVLGGTGASNRALSMQGDTVLTIGAGVSVRGINGTLGQAYLAGGTQNVVNGGSIVSDGGGTITVTPTSMINNGLMRAQSGTLTVQSPLSGTGTLQVDATGTMNLANGAKTQGTLAMGAAGAALNLGTGNLTINTDYTNTAAGTGNSFNRRAGVAGTGQIVAGANAAQAITGAGVTNGNTANATLTIGNVRVGATTFDYQVANTGNTGPALRGAIQTNVNGANLTDARLSGTGVTASNYNTGAPGSNSGNLGVTFTAANAGALAPLSGQVLNLRSNFENIADQKLNIVLAGGAAAYNAAVGAATPSPAVVANQRVGGTNTVALSVSNNAQAGAFSEDLRATFGANTGDAQNNSGIINALVAGGLNAGTMSVGVNAGSAGAKTGTVTLNYQTTGTVNGVSNGLPLAGANAPQTINVSGNVYQAAAGQIVTAPLNFNVQVGQAVTQNLEIRNTASGPNGFVEDLNASFGASGDARISGTGSLSGILAGTNSTGANGTMTVNVDTSAAGSINSNILVNYFTAGAVAGVSNGLGIAAAGSEAYGVVGTIVQGNVIDQAKPVINGVANPGAVTVNLGNVRINTAAGQTLNVLNQATGNQQAALNASIASNGAPVTASGSFNGLLPGNASPGQAGIGTLQVGLDTSAAGARSGSATVSLVSDITAFGNCAPNCTLNLANQTVNVSGNVYRLANPTLNAPTTVTVAARVGDTVAADRVVSITNSSVDAFTEGLKVSLGTITGNAQAAGGIANLGAGGTDAGSIKVGLGNTAVAGTSTATVALDFVSTGAGTTGAPDLQVGTGTVTVDGKVYAAAVGQTPTATLNFGVVRVGDTPNAKDIVIENAAALTALNDTLRADLSGVSGPFTGNGGSVAGIAAQGSGTIAVGLNTAAAGVFSQNSTVSFLSQNADMADVSAGPNANVLLQAQVNNLANADFDWLSGAGVLKQNGTDYVLDLGTVTVGAILSALLQMDNDVAGPADDLSGAFDLSAADDFGAGLSGWNPFGPLAAGQAQGGLQLKWLAAAVGDFSDTIVFNGVGTNASDPQGLAQSRKLFIRANVIQDGGGGTVPEPGTFLLLLMALAGMLLQGRRSMLH
ncbi:MAG: choice-of-anchor D domain-containing protein [Candidatus Accumulibacter necessarius]|jgi:hypothetical protein|uniref:choice-of-anchor D domain-containing protein n=1 Tax=Candidatus Accumulibacter necessarius TaxID=2954386 RepID=UPI002FC3C775